MARRVPVSLLTGGIVMALRLPDSGSLSSVLVGGFEPAESEPERIGGGHRWTKCLHTVPQQHATVNDSDIFDWKAMYCADSGEDRSPSCSSSEGPAPQTTIAHLLRIMMEVQVKEAAHPYAIALLTPQNNIQCSTSIKPIKAYTTNCSRAESLEGAHGEKFALGGREGHHLQREMRAGNQRTGAGGRQGDPSRAPGWSTTAGALYSCDDRWRVGEKMASNDHWVEEAVVVGGDHWVGEAGVVGGDHWVEEAMVVGGDHTAEEMVVGDLDEYTAEAQEILVGDSDEYTAEAQEILVGYSDDHSRAEEMIRIYRLDDSELSFEVVTATLHSTLNAALLGVSSSGYGPRHGIACITIASRHVTMQDV
ncbi:hypothetical protein F5887DRAFT_1157857 [Amanita rubescens]|nr:hypothetical protein F5887DRAFT_1157857 [Amanita rubescens]